ncbi:MAG: hypothetical protein ACPGXK_13370, partial [Phycisphaerae bacterium]
MISTATNRSSIVIDSLQKQFDLFDPALRPKVLWITGECDSMNAISREVLDSQRPLMLRFPGAMLPGSVMRDVVEFAVGSLGIDTIVVFGHSGSPVMQPENDGVWESRIHALDRGLNLNADQDDASPGFLGRVTRSQNRLQAAQAVFVRAVRELSEIVALTPNSEGKDVAVLPLFYLEESCTVQLYDE